MKSFILNGREIEVQHVLDDILPQSKLTSFEFHSLHVIRAWLAGKKQFVIKTSGSTGKPNDITIFRSQIKKSARRTIDELELKKGDTILACLYTENIAGFMMLVRAMEGDLNLIIETPTANPLKHIAETTSIDFVALTPHQLDTIMNYNPDRLNNIKKILIGGAGLSHELEEKLLVLKTDIFHSYAMTETITHVALRRVNGKDRSPFFHAVDGVSFTIDDRSCLVIDDTLLGISNLVTNDMVELKNQTSFRWLGRIDNVINSGGIKIQLEELEERMGMIFSNAGIENYFCIVVMPDKVLGEKPVLLIEKEIKSYSEDTIVDLLKGALPKYYSPTKVMIVDHLFTTKNGKIDRKRNSEVYIHGVES